MEILIRAAQLVLSLSILVIIHEFGHFAFARLFKTRVEKFYLFFNPWFSLFKKKIGDTEYGIGWLPLGGYVKIAGMIDESMDKEQMEQPAKPDEFRSKTSWQRLLIMVGGVLFNLILAVIIYIGVLWTYGEEYLPTEEAKYGVVCSETAEELGFKDGDKILTFEGEKIENFYDIVPTLLLNQDGIVKVDRDGTTKSIKMTASKIGILVENAKSKEPLFVPRFPFIVNGFSNGSGAQKAGIEKGDALLAVNGVSCKYYDTFVEQLSGKESKTIDVTVLRNNDSITTALTLDGAAKIGVYAKPLNELFNFKTLDYTFAQAIPAGMKKSGLEVSNYLKQLKLIVNPETKAYKSLGGFGTIASIFPTYWNWEAFWSMTAFLSIILAVMNILPIPALDGGHVLFLLYEMVTRRKPGDKFMEYAQMAGLIIVLGLVLFANLNDVLRLFQ